ncbi:hypothetical protein WMY93_011108 [Mugilogobius chulae]|uniref:Radial spoke head 10 homolog B2 n=1 Tax=Mugilogobius chulae TaxID=88201 RepID=A0AAW0PJL9_9GOBI
MAESDAEANQITQSVDQKQNDMNGLSRHPLTLSLVIQRYEGGTCEGLPSGEGVACFVGGHMYKGMFSKGLMDGHGTFAWAGGLKYEVDFHVKKCHNLLHAYLKHNIFQGDFVSNNMMGQGTYCWPDGSTYNGEVHYGLRHGIGSYYCAKNGVFYHGKWHKGKRQGKGAIYYNQDKTSWYKGDWVVNKIEGFGVRRYPSGNIYQGEWMNNLRHGEGKMQWFLNGQQYEGTWYNGIQHGYGKHTWILTREDGSRYSQSNQYVGDFVNGKRHGQGTFYYADGAGIFTFKNGKIFQGEFVNDQMIQLKNDKPLPLLVIIICVSCAASDSSSFLGPDMTLNIDAVLECIPEKRRAAELKEVELVVLRHITELRSIYSFYSRLGHAPSPDNTFMLSQMQLWRLLKDCKVHHHDITLSQIDFLIGAEVHLPFIRILFCKLISCLVVVAYHIYHKNMVSQRDLVAACFSNLMTNNVLPNAKNVKGFLFRQQEHTELAMRYCQRSLEIYQIYCTPKNSSQGNKTMTWKDLLFMLKDFQLFDNLLTPSNFMKIISENITFMEFFDALLGCAQIKCHSQHEEIDHVIFKSENHEHQITLTTELSSQSKTSVTADPAIGTNDTSAAHDESMMTGLPLTEFKEDGGTGWSKHKQEDQNVWEQKVHHFYKVFLNAFEQHQSVKKTIKEKNLSLKAKAHMALTKQASKNSSTRGQQHHH